VITVLLDPGRLAGDEARIEGHAYRHLFRARRIAAGARLRAVDGRGRARWAEVVAVGPQAATLALGHPAPAHEPAVALTLLVAALRRERASWLVEKATELGAAAIRFLASERAPREFGGGTLGRLRRVAAAAVEQCHRARLPEVSGVHPWGEVPALLAAAAPAEPTAPETLAAPVGRTPPTALAAPSASTRWLLDTAPGALTPAAAPFPLAGSGAEPRVAILVGPEGGWTDGERAELGTHGCAAVTLGERSLRVETAALAGAALLLARTVV
jgi:16S rRNA (uracil1498-N3)-methyltransferase